MKREKCHGNPLRHWELLPETRFTRGHVTACLEAVRWKSQLGTAYSRRGDDWLGLLGLLVGWLAGQFRLKLSEAELVSGLRHSHLPFCNSSLVLPDLVIFRLLLGPD